MQRILIAGTSGAGKTTLGRRLSQATGIPHTEIDSLYHGPEWTPRPEFVADVQRLVAGDQWIVEWQYRKVRPLLLERADTLIWLDPPYTVTLGQVTYRTVRRRLLHEELWNGNFEGPLRHLLTDPDHIIRWSIRTRHVVRDAMPQVAAEHPEVHIIRLRSRRQVRAFLNQARSNA